MVFGPEIDQQQDAGRRQALDQAVQKGLRFTVDPVQILEDQYQRLYLAFPQQQPLAGILGSAATLGRVQSLPLLILDAYVEQRE